MEDSSNDMCITDNDTDDLLNLISVEDIIADFSDHANEHQTLYQEKEDVYQQQVIDIFRQIMSFPSSSMVESNITYLHTWMLNVMCSKLLTWNKSITEFTQNNNYAYPFLLLNHLPSIFLV